MARAKKVVDEVIDDMNEMAEDIEIEDKIKEFIPTGSTLFNLAISDKHDGGWPCGTMANLIGDSSSGKSLMALTTFAAMSQNPKYDDYVFVYDDVEAASAFSFTNLFGEKASRRIKTNIISATIQDFRRNLFDVINTNKPFVYVLDSFDALTSEEEVERTTKDDGGGSYKTEKPKIASEIFRQCVRKMRETNSFLLIVSQTRDNIGFGAQFNPKIRSGGKALKFFASIEAWSSMEKTEKKKDLIIGSNVCLKVTKNKSTGKRREVYFPIYYDIGIDNTTSIVNYLVDKGHWKKEKNSIVAEDFGITASMPKIIEHIESNNLENDLDIIVGNVWNSIEDSVKLNRKKRFE